MLQIPQITTDCSLNAYKRIGKSALVLNVKSYSFSKFNRLYLIKYVWHLIFLGFMVINDFKFVISNRLKYLTFYKVFIKF